MQAPHFFTWKAYEKSELLAHKLFLLSSQFPKEEKYSLTDQIRRSSRAVTANLAESYAKRRYPKHFTAKLTDAQGENYETMSWLRSDRRCGYINNPEFIAHNDLAIEIEKLLCYMLKNHLKFRGEFANKLT